MSSVPATKLKDFIDSRLSSATALSEPLATLDFRSGTPLKIGNYNFDIVTTEVDRQGRKQGQPVTLGTIDISVTVSLSAFTDKRLANGLPDYSGVTGGVSIVGLGYDSNHNPIPQTQRVWDDLVKSSADAVVALAADTPDLQVKNACQNLRSDLQRQPLNRLDSTVFMWRIYSNSPNADSKADLPKKLASPCFNGQERQLLAKLKIDV